jgi:hypothetical protein
LPSPRRRAGGFTIARLRALAGPGAEAAFVDSWLFVLRPLAFSQIRAARRAKALTALLTGLNLAALADTAPLKAAFVSCAEAASDLRAALTGYATAAQALRDQLTAIIDSAS